MYVSTKSGLHGWLIAFVSTAGDNARSGYDGYAIIRRPGLLFSTHRLYTRPGEADYEQFAEQGHYDLTLDEALGRPARARRTGSTRTRRRAVDPLPELQPQARMERPCVRALRPTRPPDD